MAAFGQILDGALELNLERQAMMKHVKPTLSSFGWLQEHATVSLSLGRAVGKTTAISRRASAKDLVIGYNASWCKEFNNLSVFKPNVTSVYTLKDGGWLHKGNKYDRVWVDDATFIIKDAAMMRNLYELALNTHTKQIILIG